ncbi:hypothetical protein [Paenibacillus naphthalenovorans]|uniref:hypothetical protein n=1 Tax=Paenibacillus naphthalenovorans TaxID=162209 RepID=UPI000785D5E9
MVSPFAERHSSWTFYAGFNEIHNTGKCGMESAEEVTPAVLNWIEHNARKISAIRLPAILCRRGLQPPC